MLKNTFCPISDKQINEHSSRLIAAFVVVLLIVYVFSSNIFVMLFLVYDFLMRSVQKPKFSLLAILSKQLLQKTKPHLINAGPKIFSARIGFVFTFLISVSHLFSMEVLAYVFTAIIGICALLEASIGFCVGCKLYPFVYKLVHRGPSSQFTEIYLKDGHVEEE